MDKRINIQRIRIFTKSGFQCNLQSGEQLNNFAQQRKKNHRNDHSLAHQLLLATPQVPYWRMVGRQDFWGESFWPLKPVQVNSYYIT
jgi:hypothetical protein